MKRTSILVALLIISAMASAQTYVNVELKDGTVHSYSVEVTEKVSFGAKKGIEVADVAQTVTVNGHTVTVKLAEGTPANDVALHAYIEGDNVKIKAFSITNKELMCTWDDNEEMPKPNGGFYYFTISDISKDVVATLKYYPIYTVKFDMKGHGESIQDAKVIFGKTVAAPETPTTANHKFWCWCTDADCTTLYNFSKGVTSDMTLYAKWTGSINDHPYIELAGYKWATENVGYCKDVTAVARPGAVGNGWRFYFYKQEGNDALNAAQSWGNESGHTWTLPSEKKWSALIGQCYWEWTDSYNYLNSPYNGMSGYIVYEAKSANDKNQLNKADSGYTPTTVTHIFLPAAGIYYDSVRDVIYQGYGGFYWSSGRARYLYFSNGGRSMDDNGSNDGMAVRPVVE